MHPFRKIIQKTGFDLHKYRPQANYWDFIKTLKIGTILDIGANTGQFAKEARIGLPEAKIYSFEPILECFNALKDAFKGDGNFEALNYALGDIGQKMTINKSSYTPSSSLLPMSDRHKELFPHTKDHTKETIEIKRLDDVAQQLNLKKEILIKVDVQGFEMKVINGGEETFKKAKIVLIESSFTTLYEGQSSFDDIYEKLKLLNFSYKGSYQRKVNPKTGEILFEDSIFLKN